MTMRLQIAECRLQIRLQIGDAHDVPTRLPEERRVRVRQPRLRAVVHGADGRCRRRAARSSSSPSSSAAPSTASASSCRTARATTTGRGRASRFRGRTAATAPRSISTASSASTRSCSRSSRSGTGGELAIVHACGSPDSTRSHFDAQDYMESATPGVKSTSDGWLNRYLQAQHAEHATPFRAVALTSQLPRMLQGTAPALAVSQLAQFGIRAGQSSEAVGASFEAEYAAAADRRAERHRPRGVQRDQDAEDRRPVEVRAGQRRRLPAQRVRPVAAADRAAHEIERRPRGRVRRRRRLGHARQPGRRPGSAGRRGSTTSRDRSPRSSPTSAIAWPTPSC